MNEGKLSPIDRIKAVDLLSKKMANNVRNDYGMLERIITAGFAGYANFSDQQLLNGISSFAKNSNDWECQQFLTAVSAEKFLLE